MRRRIAFSTVLSLLALLGAAPAWAQATRTWVSGVGDDANPCSRTAPCKTFAGAISKTAAGGEINVLDPGGFGAVTITKSMTIRADGATAGVLAAGTNGVIVNAGANDVVVLRGLDFEGFGTGLDGVRFLAGGALHVEDCQINGFSQAGIRFSPSGSGKLYVENTTVRNNNPATGSSHAGVYVIAAPGQLVEASLEDVRILRAYHGLRVDGNVRATATRCATSGNTGTGVLAGTNTKLNLEGCEVFGNGNGVRANGAGAVIRMANTLVTANTLNGLLTGGGGVIQSFGNNRIVANAVDGAPSTVLGQD